MITAIGDNNTLAAAMEIPGGVSGLRRMGGDTTVLIRDTVDITALRPLFDPSLRSARESGESQQMTNIPPKEHHGRRHPTDLRYTAEHEWVKSTGEDTVRVGITALPRRHSGMSSRLRPEHRRRGHCR